MLIANFLCSRGKPWCVRCCCAAWWSRPPGFEILWGLIKVFWFPKMEYKHWRLYLNNLLESLLLEYLLLHQCLKIEVDHQNMLQYNMLQYKPASNWVSKLDQPPFVDRERSEPVKLLRHPETKVKQRQNKGKTPSTSWAREREGVRCEKKLPTVGCNPPARSRFVFFHSQQL